MQRDNLLSLFKNCDFVGHVAQDNFESRILDNLPDDFIYDYFYGASKVCIIPKGADFVIKIPFNSCWYDCDEDYTDFYQATCDNKHNWDYCFAEVLAYREAKREKVSKAFCKARLLGYINDYPIYIQERALPISEIEEKRDEYGEYSDERTPSSEEYCHRRGYNCFNPVWIADALEYYGQQMFNKIMLFVYDNNIGDLHSDNIGYIGTRPVLIDYSDFYE